MQDQFLLVKIIIRIWSQRVHTGYATFKFGWKDRMKVYKKAQIQYNKIKVDICIFKFYTYYLFNFFMRCVPYLYFFCNI